MCRKELFVVGAAIVIVTAVMMFFPVTGTTGSPDPHTPPILNNIPPAWSQKLPAEHRFVLVLDDEAVLDKETGLVWERDVSGPTDTGAIPCFNWYDAVVYCTSLTKGERSGWHLPTVEQLASLIDKSVSGSPKLPAGHPFIGVQLPACGGFWSATSDASNVDWAWIVGFNNGVINHGPNYIKTNVRRAWCVRGGQSHDGY
ncbi:MAG: DUF1566 domain-containing protein [Nitrospirae bacterium]|nr:DUF1566 domain-containing protein [Nitrospirota bacterium]